MMITIAAVFDIVICQSSLFLTQQSFRLTAGHVERVFTVRLIAGHACTFFGSFLFSGSLTQVTGLLPAIGWHTVCHNRLHRRHVSKPDLRDV
jgi:hypothetical protein